MGLFLADLSAARAPGVATTWPRGNSGVMVIAGMGNLLTIWHGIPSRIRRFLSTAAPHLSMASRVALNSFRVVFGADARHGLRRVGDFLEVIAHPHQSAAKLGDFPRHLVALVAHRGQLLLRLSVVGHRLI